MKMKRLYSILTLLICGLFLVACANENGNTVDTNTPTNRSTEVSQTETDFCNAELSEDGTCSGNFEGDFWDILNEPGIIIEGDGIQTIEVDLEQDGQNTIENVVDEDTE